MNTIDRYRAADAGQDTLDLLAASDEYANDFVNQQPQAPAPSLEGPATAPGMIDVASAPKAEATSVPNPVKEVDPFVAKLSQAGKGNTAKLYAQMQLKANAQPGGVAKTFMAITGNSWEDKKTSYETALSEAQQLINEDKFDLAHQRLNYEKDALVEVTSPVEFIGSGGGAALRIAGKTALKVFAAGSPIEYAGTVIFEEVAKDNMLVGMTGMIASGVGAGMIGQKMINSAGKSALSITASADEINEVALRLRPQSGKDIVEYAWPKGEQVLAEMRKNLPGQDYELADPLNVYTRLYGKRADTETNAYITNFTFGDISDSNVRVAYKNLISEANELGISGEQAGLMRALELKLEATEVPKPVPAKTLADAQLGKTEAPAPKPDLKQMTIIDEVTPAPAAATSVDDTGTPLVPKSTAPETVGQIADTPNSAVPAEPTVTTTPEPVVEAPAAAIEAPAAPIESGINLTPETYSTVTAPDDIHAPFMPNTVNPAQAKALREATITEWFGEIIVGQKSMADFEAQIAKSDPKMSKATVKTLAKKRFDAELSKGYVARISKENPNMPREEVMQRAEAELNADRAAGYLGSDFRADVDDLYNSLVSKAKKAKIPVDAAKLRQQALQITKEEYETEVEKALAKKIASARSLEGVKKSYIEGLSGNPYEDQNLVEMNIHFLPETGTLVYDETLNAPLAGSKSLGDYKSSLFDYGSLNSRAAAEHAMKQFIHKGETARVWNPEAKKKILPGADKLKQDSWYFSGKSGKTESTSAIKDDIYVRVAKMFGWSEDKITPKQSVGKDGTKYYTDQTDAIAGFKGFHEFEQSMPGWLRGEADKEYNAIQKFLADNKLTALDSANPEHVKALQKIVGETRPDPRYYKLSFGRAAYMSDVKEFLSKSFNLPKDAPPWAVAQRVEEIAVMQEKMLEDVRRATGTNQELVAKRMYMLFQDKITGSHSLDYARTVNQAKIRELGYREVTDFQARRVSDPANQLDADQGKYGMSMDSVADDADMTDVDNLAYSTSSVKPGDDAIADAYEAGLSIKNGSTLDQFAEYADERKLAYAKQVNKIEERFGVGFAEPEYVPSATGGSGKFNLFKINSASDLMVSLSKLDEAYKAEPFFFDTELKLGLTPKAGLPQPQAAKLGIAIQDSQLMLDDLAQKMIADPNNAVTSLAFEKTRAIHQTLVDALTKDDLSLSPPKLDAYNFMAADDMQMAQNFGKSIMDNFVMHSNIGPDTRLSTVMAQMYSQMPTMKAKATFLTRAAAVETTNPPVAVKQTVALRQQVSKMIEDACAKH